MTSRTFSVSSHSSSTTTKTSSSTNSLIQELHPLPSPDTLVPPPLFNISDIVFIVGEGNSSREMCEVVDIGYKASEQCYVYDCTPLYNPALQGLFLCRDKDLRKSRFGVGEEIAALGDGMRVLDLRYLEGRFCYRIGRGGVGGKERESGVQKDELLLEEEDLVRIVEGRLKENQRP